MHQSGAEPHRNAVCHYSDWLHGNTRHENKECRR